MTGEQVIDTHYQPTRIFEWFPEIRRIEDDSLQQDTMDALRRGTPEYFWHVPATSSGRYHNTYARGEHGLYIHVKMLFAAYERVVDSYVEQGLVSDFGADVGRSAILLHDMLKYGHSYDEGDDTADNHDELTAMWLREHTELPDVVPDCVAAHMGPWGGRTSPSTDVEQLVHTADMIASSDDITCGVYDPPERVVARYPSLPRATL